MIREIVLVFQETQFEKVLSQEPVQKRKTAENPLIFKKLWIRLAVELEGWVEGAVILRFSEGMYSYGVTDESPGSLKEMIIIPTIENELGTGGCQTQSSVM